MAQSIRRYLLVNLFIGVLLATLLAVLSNLYVGYKSIRPHLDAQMAGTAHAINAFLPDNMQDPMVLDNIQQRTAAYLHGIEHVEYDDPAHLPALHSSLDSIHFRVYSKQGNQITQSPGAPRVSAYPAHGFGKFKLQDKLWRVYALVNTKGEKIVVMQPHDARLFIEKTINTRSILIILLVIPPLGIFIWIVIGRSLRGLTRTCDEIRQRAHHNLQPIASDSIPEEIVPLILELNHLFAHLQDNFQREQRFAADAAHELKTPLAALKTHVQVAQATTSMQMLSPILAKILLGVDRATHTVDQLLILSRTMPDAYIQQHKAISITQVITAVLAEITPKALEKNIDLIFNNNAPHAAVSGHAVAIEILLRNIVANAIAYTHADTAIKVGLRYVDTWIELSVEDEGPGISPELYERVFARFYRILGNKANGSGLGLSIVKHIAACHDATVELSTPSNNIGLRVTVRFPNLQKDS